MHRINRIGSNSIGDLDKSEITLSFGANFDVKDSTLPVHSCNPINAVAGEHYMSEHWLMDSSPDLATNSNVGFGIFLNMNERDTNLDHVIACTGILNFGLADVTGIRVQAYLGRVNVAQAADTPVVINTPLEIPIIGKLSNDGVCAWFNEQVILQSGNDGGSPPTNYFDMVLYWRISNRSGSDEAIIGLEGRLTAWKYHNDLFTYDPNR